MAGTLAEKTKMNAMTCASLLVGWLKATQAPAAIKIQAEARAPPWKSDLLILFLGLRCTT